MALLVRVGWWKGLELMANDVLCKSRTPRILSALYCRLARRLLGGRKPCVAVPCASSACGGWCDCEDVCNTGQCMSAERGMGDDILSNTTSVQ